ERITERRHPEEERSALDPSFEHPAKERARNQPVIQTAKEWPALPGRHAALLKKECGKKRDESRPRCRERQHRYAHKPALRIGAKRPKRCFLWRLERVLQPLNWCALFPRHHPPGQRLDKEKRTEHPVDQTPAACRGDEPRTGADGGSKEHTM